MFTVKPDVFYKWVLCTQGGNKVTSGGKVLCFNTKAQAEKSMHLMNAKAEAKLSQGK